MHISLALVFYWLEYLSIYGCMQTSQQLRHQFFITFQFPLLQGTMVSKGQEHSSYACLRVYSRRWCSPSMISLKVYGRLGEAIANSKAACKPIKMSVYKRKMVPFCHHWSHSAWGLIHWQEQKLQAWNILATMHKVCPKCRRNHWHVRFFYYHFAESPCSWNRQLESACLLESDCMTTHRKSLVSFWGKSAVDNETWIVLIWEWQMEPCHPWGRKLSLRVYRWSLKTIFKTQQLSIVIE